MSVRQRVGMVVLAALAILAGGAARAPVAGAAVSVSVSRTPVTRPIAADFLGIALEYNTIPAWVGSGSGPVDPPLVQLIRNLQPAGRPLVRVGGQSSDRAWWPVRGLPQPRGVTYILTDAWTKAAHALARALNGRFMLGLNLEANRTRIPQQEARRLLAGVGRAYVSSFQLGNEPELYTATPWYRVINGKPVPWYSKTGSKVLARPRGYSAADFAAEFGRIEPLLPTVPLAGPETGNPLFMADFLRFLSPRSQVRTLTYHAYGNNGCYRDPAEPLYPTIPHLLDTDASRELVAGFEGFIAAAHRNGATFRIDEMGSVTCNGWPGVSNTMASALWALDALFAVARAGVDGVNLHSYPNSINGLFDLTQTKRGWQAVVHPIYYGALMFAQAAPAGSRLIRVVAGGQPQVRVWATLGADHLVRVLLLNDGSRSVESVIHSPAGYGSRPAALERLRAPSVAATHGVTLGGRQFGTTSTGVLAPPVPQAAAPDRGTYTVSLPADSAALLTLSPR